MNELQIAEMNKGIHYLDGKIVWHSNKGYTSALMQKLYGYGYHAGVSGCIHTLYDDKNRVVTTGYTWEGLLYNTAIVMR